MPPKFKSENTGNAKLSLTVTAETAEDLRAVATQSGMSLAQVVRAALGLYKFVESLGPDEELYVRDRATQELTRVAIVRV